MTKSIAYAYPTSDTAKEAGFYDSGCHYIALGEGWDVKQKTGFSTDKAAVIKAAEAMPEEWFEAYAYLYDIENGHRDLTHEERQQRHRNKKAAAAPLVQINLYDATQPLLF